MAAIVHLYVHCVSKPSSGCTDKLEGLEIWKTHVKMSEMASSIRVLFITNMPLPRELLLSCRIGRDMAPRYRGQKFPGKQVSPRSRCFARVFVDEEEENSKGCLLSKE
jgi:hypothetical protein